MAVAFLFADREHFLSDVFRHLGCRTHAQHQNQCGSHGAMSATFFFGSNSRTGILASNTRLKKPTIISSQLCSPQITSLVGSALSGLLGELSKCAVQSILVPLGRAIGSSRLYQFCQCQS